MTSLLKATTSALNTLTDLASILASIGLSMIVASYVFEVTSRYIFSSPTAWASDFVAYALCSSAFLALPRVTKDKAHVAVTILVDVAPKAVANIIHIFVSILGFLSLSCAAWISLQENIRQFNRDIHTLAMVPIPQWWVSSFITFGLALSACYLLIYISPNQRIGSGGISRSEGAD